MLREIKVFRYKAFGLTNYPHKVHSGLGQHQGTLHDSVDMCMWGALPEDSGQSSAPTCSSQLQLKGSNTFTSTGTEGR